MRPWALALERLPVVRAAPGRELAIGALSGGTLGGVRSHSQNQQAEQAQRQRGEKQLAQDQQRRNNYNRAFGACLEGRGYTVR